MRERIPITPGPGEPLADRGFFLPERRRDAPVLGAERQEQEEEGT